MARCIVTVACLAAAALFGTRSVRAQSRTAEGPPAPVPYRHIPDPADDAERRVVVKAEDRGPVWLLTGLLNEGNDGNKDYLDMLARLKPRHWRQGNWPFWYPVSITTAGREGRKTWGDFRGSPKAFGQLLETMLRLQERGMIL